MFTPITQACYDMEPTARVPQFLLNGVVIRGVDPAADLALPAEKLCVYACTGRGHRTCGGRGGCVSECGMSMPLLIGAAPVPVACTLLPRGGGLLWHNRSSGAPLGTQGGNSKVSRLRLQRHVPTDIRPGGSRCHIAPHAACAPTTQSWRMASVRLLMPSQVQPSVHCREHHSPNPRSLMSPRVPEPGHEVQDVHMYHTQSPPPPL